MLKVQNNGRLMMTKTAIPDRSRTWGWVYLALIIGIIGWSIWRGEQHAQQMAAYREETRPARELAEHIDRRGALYMTINSSGQIIEWTKAGERLTGYSAGDILGANLATLLPEEMREKHQVAFDRATKQWTIDDQWTITCEIVTKTGARLPVSIFVWRLEDARYSAVIWQRRKT